MTRRRVIGGLVKNGDAYPSLLNLTTPMSHLKPQRIHLSLPDDIYSRFSQNFVYMAFVEFGTKLLNSWIGASLSKLQQQKRRESSKRWLNLLGVKDRFQNGTWANSMTTNAKTVGHTALIHCFLFYSFLQFTTLYRYYIWIIKDARQCLLRRKHLPAICSIIMCGES